MDAPQHTVPPAEVAIDDTLVRRLLVAQFPQWADLPLTPVVSAGWDNTMYRLGADLVVRLPRRRIGAEHVVHEHRWMPLLAPHLPLPVPVPVGQGEPGEGYPWPWTVTPWLPGDIAAVAPIPDIGQAAMKLAEFVAALRRIDPTGGPPSRFRDVPLSSCDDDVRAAIDALDQEIDRRRVIRAWERALAAPERHGPAVWMHGDLHPANLLVHDGRLSGVIDFGLLAVGDPACDLMVAWTALAGPARALFRKLLAVDEATWARARGWALDMGLMCASHAPVDSTVGQIGRHTVRQVIAEAEPTR
jgi:aminoglycoside phosphotransferase (APT) family kinase protein